MSKPRFFIVPAKVADTIISRHLRWSWVDEQGCTQVLLSSADLFVYGINKALANGAMEANDTQVHEIIESIKNKNCKV